MNRLGALVILCAAFSGCATNAAIEGASDKPPTTAMATVDTGGVNGRVTDDELQPVPGATVTVIGGNGSVQSDAAGRFAISFLEPTDYLLRVTAPNFTSKQVGVNVRPGEITHLNVTLQRIAVPVPYIDAGTVFNGYLGAAVNVTAGGQSRNTTSSEGTAVPEQYRTRNQGRLGFGAGWKTMQLEVAWTAGQSLANRLELRLELPQKASTGGCSYNLFIHAGEGTSPFKIRVDDASLAGVRARWPALCGMASGQLIFRVYPASASGQPVGAFVDQQFTVYGTVGYLEPLPDDYTRLPH